MLVLDVVETLKSFLIMQLVCELTDLKSCGFFETSIISSSSPLNFCNISSVSGLRESKTLVALWNKDFGSPM